MVLDQNIGQEFLPDSAEELYERQRIDRNEIHFAHGER